MVAGVMGSFLFGLSMGLLNASMAWIGAELWPCKGPEWVVPAAGGVPELTWPTGWDVIEVSPECDALLQQGPDSNGTYIDIAECNAGIASTDLPAFCDGCVTPSFSSCDYVTWMNAILNICVLVGAFAACMLGGKLLPMGIRNCNAICMIIFMVGAVCSVCSGSIASICCARLITGFAVGMTSLYCPMYIAQMSPMTKKGSYGVAHQLVLTIGILLAVLLGLAFGAGPFISTWNSVTGPNMELESFPKIYWRCMMSLGYAIPVFINLFLFSRFNMDTPTEYIARGQYQDAKEGLYRIYKTNDDSVIMPYFNDILVAMKNREKALSSGLTLGKAMKIPAYRKMILIGCAGSAIQQLSGINVFVTASNQLFKQAGVEPDMVTVLSTVMTALNCIMTFPTIVLIEKMGRKSLMVCGIAGQCIGAILPTIGQWVDADAYWSQIMSIVGIMVLVCSFAVAMGPVLWVWFTEIFPADVNHAASSALVATNWMTGIIMVFVGTAVTNNKILFTIFTVLNVGSLVFGQIFFKETKGLPAGVSPYL